jgi:hypothetical protein
MAGVEISSSGGPPLSLPCSHCSLLSARVGMEERGQLDTENIIVYLVPGIATLILSLRYANLLHFHILQQFFTFLILPFFTFYADGVFY